MIPVISHAKSDTVAGTKVYRRQFNRLVRNSGIRFPGIPARLECSGTYTYLGGLRVNQDFGCNFWISDKPLSTRLASLIIPILRAARRDPLRRQPTRNYYSGTPHRAICLSGLDGASCHGRERLRPRLQSESFAYWKCLRLGRQKESAGPPFVPLRPTRVHAIQSVRSSCS
jgi:hypothetical protein